MSNKNNQVTFTDKEKEQIELIIQDFQNRFVVRSSFGQKKSDMTVVYQTNELIGKIRRL
jgi:predicted metal-dependent TIM-barrel fold hydrolase